MILAVEIYIINYILNEIIDKKEYEVLGEKIMKLWEMSWTKVKRKIEVNQKRDRCDWEYEGNNYELRKSEKL